MNGLSTRTRKILILAMELVLLAYASLSILLNIKDGGLTFIAVWISVIGAIAFIAFSDVGWEARSKEQREASLSFLIAGIQCLKPNARIKEWLGLWIKEYSLRPDEVKFHRARKGVLVGSLVRKGIDMKAEVKA